LRLRWTPLALADFLEAQDHIAKHNPIAAQAVAQHIDEATSGLLGSLASAGPDMSRARASAWSAKRRT